MTDPSPRSKPETAEPSIIEPKDGELLPCPFCGSPAGLEHDNNSAGQWRVYCRDIGPAEGCAIGLTNSDNYSRRADAVGAWNKRTVPAQASKPETAMRTALESIVSITTRDDEQASLLRGSLSEIRVTARAALAAVPAQQKLPDREGVAQYIYQNFLSYPGPGSKPAWIPGGNSLKQDEARKHADNIIDGLAPIPLPPQDAPAQQQPEPVAWRWRYEDTQSWAFRARKPSLADDVDVVCEPLYVAPVTPHDSKDDHPVEVWHGDRKVTVYADTVLRVWGPNIETEISEEPRTHDSVGAAFNWLYAQSQEVSGSVPSEFDLTPKEYIRYLTIDRDSAKKERDELRIQVEGKPKPILVKRPVAFRVPRVVDDKLSATEWRLFDDEKQALEAAEQIDDDYQALFVRDGTAILAEWQPIDTAPKGDDDFFLVCGVGDDRSPFVMRGTILWSARKANTPSHLHLHWLTHWMPLPAPPTFSSDKSA